MASAAASIVLEEAINADFEPTVEEIKEYALWLGIDLEKHPDLLWIAESGIKASLPPDWMPCQTGDNGDIFYFNSVTGESVWDHPCDEHHRELLKQELEKKARAASGEDDPAESSNQSLSLGASGDQDDEKKGKKDKKEKKMKKEKKLKIAGMSAPRELAPLGRVGVKLGNKEDGDGDATPGSRMDKLASGGSVTSGGAQDDEDSGAEDEQSGEMSNFKMQEDRRSSGGAASAAAAAEAPASAQGDRFMGANAARGMGPGGDSAASSPSPSPSSGGGGGGGGGASRQEATEVNAKGQNVLESIAEEEFDSQSSMTSGIATERRISTMQLESEFDKKLAERRKEAQEEFEKQVEVLKSDNKMKITKMKKELESEFEMQRDSEFGELNKKHDKEVRELKQRLTQELSAKKEALQEQLESEGGSESERARLCEAARAEMSAILQNQTLEELCSLPERKRNVLLADAKLQRALIAAGAVAELEALLNYKNADVLKLSCVAFDACRGGEAALNNFNKVSKELDRQVVHEALLERDLNGNVPLHYCKDVAVATTIVRLSPLGRVMKNVHRQRPIQTFLSRNPTDATSLTLLVTETVHLLEQDDRGVSPAMLTQGAARLKLVELISSWDVVETALSKPASSILDGIRSFKPSGCVSDLIAYHLFGEEDVWKRGRLTSIASARLNVVYKCLESVLNACFENTSDGDLCDFAHSLLLATKGPSSLKFDPREPFRGRLAELTVEVEESCRRQLDTSFREFVDRPENSAQWIADEPDDPAPDYRDSRWPGLDLAPRPRWVLPPPGWLLDSEPDLKAVFQGLKDVNALSTSTRDFVYEMMRMSNAFGQGQATGITHTLARWYAAWLQGVCQQTQHVAYQAVKSSMPQTMSECDKCPVKGVPEIFEALEDLAAEFQHLAAKPGRTADKERELAAIQRHLANFVCDMLCVNCTAENAECLKEMLSQVHDSAKLKVFGSKNCFAPSVDDISELKYRFKLWVECDVPDRGSVLAEVRLNLKAFSSKQRLRTILADVSTGRYDWPQWRQRSIMEVQLCRSKSDMKQLRSQLSDKKEDAPRSEDYNQLLSERDALRAEVESAKAAAGASGGSSEEAESLRKQLDAKTKEMAEVQAEAAATGEKLKQFEQKMTALATKAEEFERAQVQLEEKTREVARLEEELKQTKLDGAAALQMFEKQLQEQTTALERAQSQSQQGTADADALQRLRDDHSKELSLVRADLATKTSELERLRADAESTSTLSVKLLEEQGAAKLARAESAKVSEQLAEALAKFDAKRREVADLTGRCADLKAQLESANAASASKESSMDGAVQAAVLVAEAERDAYKKECERLRAENSNASGLSAEEAEKSAVQLRTVQAELTAAHLRIEDLRGSSEKHSREATKLQEELAALKAAHGSKEAECRRLEEEGSAKASASSAELQTLQATAAASAVELKSLRASHDELEEKLRGHAASKAELEARVRQSALELQTLQGELETKARECERLRASAADGAGSLGSLRDEMQQLHSKLGEESAALRQAKAEAAAAQLELSTAKATLETRTAECERLQSRHSEATKALNDDLQNVQKDLFEERNNAAQARAEASSASRELTMLRADLEAKTQDCKRLQEKVAGSGGVTLEEFRRVQNQLDEERRMVAKANADASSASCELTSLRSELEARMSDCARLRAETATAKHALEDARHLQSQLEDSQAALAKARAEVMASQLEMVTLRAEVDAKNGQLTRALAEKNNPHSAPTSPEISAGHVRIQAMLKEEQKAAAQARSEVEQLRAKLDASNAACAQLRREAAEVDQARQGQLSVQQQEEQGKIRCLEVQLEEEQARSGHLQVKLNNATSRSEAEIASLQKELESRAAEVGRLRADLLQQQDITPHEGDVKVVAGLRAQVAEYKAQVDRLKQQALSSPTASPEETQYLRASVKDRDDVILELKSDAAQTIAKHARQVEELQTKLTEARAREKRRHVEDSTERVNEYHAQLRSQASEIERLHADARMAASEVERLRCEARAATSKLGVAEEAHASAIEQQRREVQRMQDLVRERDSEVSVLKEHLERIRSGVLRHESEEQRATKRLEAAKNDVDHARQETQSLRDQLVELERCLEDARATCRAEVSARNHVDGQLRESTREMRLLKEKVQQHQTESDSIREEARRYRGEVADRDAEVARFQKQLQHIEASERQLRSRMEGNSPLHNSWAQLGQRERMLQERDQALRERESLVMEAEVLLHERRKDVRDDLERSNIVGIPASTGTRVKEHCPDATRPTEILESTLPAQATTCSGINAAPVGAADAIASAYETEAEHRRVPHVEPQLRSAPGSPSPAVAAWMEGTYVDGDGLGRDCDDTVGSRAVAEAAASLEARRKYLRRERVELEELRRRWRADMQHLRAVGGSQQSSTLLREVRVTLDQRASALNKLINEHRALERDLMLAQFSGQRQRVSKSQPLEADTLAELSSLACGGGTATYRSLSARGPRATPRAAPGGWADPTEDLALFDRWQRVLGPDAAASGGYPVGRVPSGFGTSLDDPALYGIRGLGRPLTSRSHLR